MGFRVGLWVQRIFELGFLFRVFVLGLGVKGLVFKPSDFYEVLCTRLRVSGG